MAKSRKFKNILPPLNPLTKSTKMQATPDRLGPEPARSPVRKPQVQSAGPSKRKSKQDACLSLLARPNGATLEDLQSATGWQAHSVRGFISGTVGKRLGHAVRSVKTAAGERRYHIAAQ